MKKIFVRGERMRAFHQNRGGLADMVVGALPGALDKSRFDVRVVLPTMPVSRPLRDGLQYTGSFQMNLGSLG